jgi:predicted GIY-YIG superfamily endonuclease
MKKYHKYWNKETILLHSKECSTRSEFKLKYWGGWNLAHKLNILDSLNLERHGDREHRCIYACEFEDNSVYIGLTFNYKSRINEHLNSNHKSSIKEYIRNNPNVKYCFKQLTEYIDKEKASIQEGEFLHNYKNNGWNVLNKSKTGTLGSPYSIIKLLELKEIFLKYSSWKELINSKDYKYYCVAKKRGLLNQLYYKNNIPANRFKWDEDLALSICNQYKLYKDIKNNKIAFNAFRFIERMGLKYKLNLK